MVGASGASAWELALLGPVELLGPGGPVPLGGPRRATLLAVLGARFGEVVSVETLIDELWGDDPPKTARPSLQAHISRLRGLLDACPDLEIVTEPGGYRLRGDADTVDLVRLGTAVTAASELLDTDPEAALTATDGALELWRGAPMAGTRPGSQLGAAIAQVRERRAQLLETRTAALIELGRFGEAAAELAGQVVDHPLREQLWSQLMLAQYHLGRQADALATYRAARQQLARLVGVEPGHRLQRLHADILHQRIPAAAGGDSQRATSEDQVAGNLPEPSNSFHDRTEELAAIADRVAEHRLVTLTGVGGGGKTRLALEFGRRHGSEFRDGVWLVDLLAVHDDDVASALMRTLGSSQTATGAVERDLLSSVAGRELLLLLDNCEHLIEPVARLLPGLLAAAPALTVLATSRQPLGIAGEAVLRVRPLSVPDADAGFEAVSASPAVRLLTDRAAALRPDLRFEERTATHLAEITRRLDGLPLALELAAARLRAMSPREVAERLGDRFRLLTDPRATSPDGRRRTLLATVEWSHEMLSHLEQRVLRRLSVFEGGFDLAAAAAVAGGDDIKDADVVDVLTGLVDGSLVSVTTLPDGTSRYALLETLRSFAADRLQEAGGTADAVAAHAQHYLALARRVLPEIEGEGQASAVRVLHREHDNLRAALDRAVDRGDVELAVALLTSLWSFWFRFGYAGEGIRWIRQIRSAAGSLPEELQAEFLAAAGNLAWLQGDNPTAWEASTRAHEIAAHHGNDRVQALSRMIMGMCRYRDGETAVALEWLAEANGHARAAEDAWLTGTTTVLAGFVRRDAGDTDAAAETFEAALGIFEVAGDAWGVSLSNHGLGTLRVAAGALDDAADLLGRALVPVVELGELQGVGCNLAAIGCLCVEADAPEEGAVLLAAADALFDRLGAGRNTLVGVAVGRVRGRLEQELDDAHLRALEQRGRELTMDGAVDVALEAVDQRRRASTVV